MRVTSPCGREPVAKDGQRLRGSQQGLAFLSTHPSGPDRIRELQQNVPKVGQGLYQAARKAGWAV